MPSSCAPTARRASIGLDRPVAACLQVVDANALFRRGDRLKASPNELRFEVTVHRDDQNAARPQTRHGVSEHALNFGEWVVIQDLVEHDGVETILIERLERRVNEAGPGICTIGCARFLKSFVGQIQADVCRRAAARREGGARL